jgi:DNA-directed RNA polymerase subunit RPC12/RpoP
MNRTAKWICLKCKKEIEVTDIEEVIRLEKMSEPASRACSCGGKMVAVTAAEAAAKDGFYWCVAKEDFCMTDLCPMPNCDEIQNCHRCGFFNRELM